MRIAGGFLFTAGWCAYLGGALVMELVWRPVQAHIPPSQTGALCLAMGRVYKRIALAALAAILTGLVMVTRGGQVAAHSTTGSLLHGSDLGLLIGVATLAVLVAGMAAIVHPLSHTRSPVSAGEGGYRAGRRRRRTAIAVMGVMLKIELALALCLGILAVLPATTGATS